MEDKETKLTNGASQIISIHSIQDTRCVCSFNDPLFVPRCDGVFAVGFSVEFLRDSAESLSETECSNYQGSETDLRLRCVIPGSYRMNGRSFAVLIIIISTGKQGEGDEPGSTQSRLGTGRNRH